MEETSNSGPSAHPEPNRAEYHRQNDLQAKEFRAAQRREEHRAYIEQALERVRTAERLLKASHVGRAFVRALATSRLVSAVRRADGN